MFNGRLSAGALTGLLLATGAGVAIGWAQQDEGLSKRAAKDVVKQAERDLSMAKKAQAKGDIPGMQRALESYTRRMEQVQDSLEQAEKTQPDHTDVADIVANATSKHTRVLEGLLEKVPSEGRTGLETALDASRRGHETAVENLRRAREERVQRGVGRSEGRRSQGEGPRVGATQDRRPGADRDRGRGEAGDPGARGGPGARRGPEARPGRPGSP